AKEGERMTARPDPTTIPSPRGNAQRRPLAAPRRALALAPLAALLFAGAASAQGAAPAINAGNTAWMLVSTALVFVMTPALAFFYGGLVRAKNVLNTMMMSYVALGVVAVLWLLAGYTLAFAPGSALLGGLAWLGLNGVGQAPSETYMTTIPHLVFMVFQAMFAIITPALISGAIAERMNFKAYVAFIALWSLVVYAPLAHWVWAADGWLFKLGALDFAGGTVVHISAGVSALVATLMLGQRRGHGQRAFAPHNVPFVLLGAGLLWFGWFGFNAGSAGAANGLAASAFVTTNMAAAAALVMWALLDTLRTGKPTAAGLATGAVVGLVAITPAAGFVTPLASLVIGAAGAAVSFTALQIKARFSYDDALDVFACHGLGGITGALLTGVFATKAVNAAGSGVVDGHWAQLGIQAVGVLSAVALAAAGTFVVLLLVKAVTAVRAGTEDEEAGLDLANHGEAGYHNEEFGFGEAIAGLGRSVTLSRPAFEPNAADD
ncbi:MAG TPA: ammonium transporter, partial [Deinococcales bacterium]|nr:ammonium transporter [Deinococcales bacterium]